MPRDPEEAARARRIRDLGIVQSRTERAQAIGYAVEGFGLRAHLPAINAAIGRAQLARFPVVAERRKELWSAYRAGLDGIGGVSVIDVDIARSVPFNCVVRIEEKRDQVFARLRDHGIGVGVHYPPNHVQTAFAAWHRPLPQTELAAQQVLSLPFHPALTSQDASHVVDLLREALK